MEIDHVGAITISILLSLPKTVKNKCRISSGPYEGTWQIIQGKNRQTPLMRISDDVGGHLTIFVYNAYKKRSRWQQSIQHGVEQLAGYHLGQGPTDLGYGMLYSIEKE